MKEGGEMDKFIEELMERGMGQLMDRSRDRLAAADRVYREDGRREEAAERRFLSLGLTEEQKAAVDSYLDCIRIGSHRYADISYMAGIRDAVGMLASLGLLKGAGEEGGMD